MRTKVLAVCVMAAILVMGGAAPAAMIDVNPGDSIQAAINGAADGDTINVAAGTYDETLSINKPISLIGAGPGSTSLTCTSGSHEQLIFLGTNSGSSIAGDLTVQGFSLLAGAGLTGSTPDLIKFRLASTTGTITIEDNIFDGNGQADIEGIVESQGAGNFNISNNTFQDLRRALWFNNAHDGTVAGNTMDACGIGMGGNDAKGNGPRDLVITENTIDDAGYSFVLANNIERIDFTYNTITDSTGAAVLYWEYGTHEEWGDVVFHYNNFEGNAEGFMGYNDPAAMLPVIVDATENWWGDPTGPSGGAVDPITSAVANGSGNSIRLGNLHFDPYGQSPYSAPSGSTIPEPMTMLAVGMSVAGVGGYVRRRRRG